MTNKEKFLKLVSEDDTQILIEIKNRIKKRMTQTAVEWLFTYLPQIDYSKDPYYHGIFHQAKEMEKQQIIDSWNDGICNWDNEKSSEQYYNEKYNV